MSIRQTLVLLPGLLCDAALWRHQAADLSGIADITIGDMTRDDSVPAMSRRVLEAAPARFALAGLSMGGYVAQEIMRRAPERIERLALLDTSARADNEEQMARRRGLIELARKGEFKGVSPRLLPTFLHPDRLSDAVLTGEVMAMAERVGRDAFLRQQKAIMARVDGREDLRRITCPTLILCGEQDILTPLKLHEEIAERILHAKLVVVPHCGHLSTMEQPEAVTAALRDWLAA
jgi:pimeloyl-ACP methyl ester carboxylesterase